MKFDRLNTNLSFLKKCIDNSDCSEYKITKEECSIYLDKIERGRKKLRNLQENIVAYLFIPCLLITSLLVMSYCLIAVQLCDGLFNFGFIFPFTLFSFYISVGICSHIEKSVKKITPYNIFFFPMLNSKIESFFDDCLNKEYSFRKNHQCHKEKAEEKIEPQEFLIDEFGAQYTVDKKKLIKIPMDTKSYEVPEGVEIIGKGAFAIRIQTPNSLFGSYGAITNFELEEVFLSDTIKTIEEGAFAECSKLKSINITGSIKEIGPYAFQRCRLLKNLFIPPSITIIQPYTFQGCDSLTTIVIPKSTKTIGYCAFANCIRLSSITILGENVDIHKTVLRGCLSLKKIIIPVGERMRYQSIFPDYKNIIYENENRTI